MADGKYCTLVLLKQYLLGTRVDPNNPSILNQGVINTPDDTLLSDAIFSAESHFELLAGTGYDQQTYTNVAPILSYIDMNGWLHLFARERGPVTAVSALQVRDVMFGSSVTWQPLTFDPVNDLVLPPFSLSDTHPLPESWHVQVWPSPAFGPRASGQILVKWSYTGGFATIPTSLSYLIAEVAAYIYKRREIPVGKVTNLPLGTVTVPMHFPPDLVDKITRWSPKYG